jgi:hypothetical protein
MDGLPDDPALRKFVTKHKEKEDEENETSSDEEEDEPKTVGQG